MVPRGNWMRSSAKDEYNSDKTDNTEQRTTTTTDYDEDVSDENESYKESKGRS